MDELFVFSEIAKTARTEVMPVKCATQLTSGDHGIDHSDRNLLANHLNANGLNEQKYSYGLDSVWIPNWNGMLS